MLVCLPQDAFLADPIRTMVADLEEKQVLAPSRVTSKTTGKRYVIVNIIMALDADQLGLRFGKGAKHKLMVREQLVCETWMGCV